MNTREFGAKPFWDTCLVDSDDSWGNFGSNFRYEVKLSLCLFLIVDCSPSTMPPRLQALQRFSATPGKLDIQEFE